ncbi:MAG: hypothetical protein H6962_08885 [Chromatiaceae bacterium]|nr:hypothetical protein [Chromatiaceae bacterium]
MNTIPDQVAPQHPHFSLDDDGSYAAWRATANWPAGDAASGIDRESG